MSASRFDGAPPRRREGARLALDREGAHPYNPRMDRADRAARDAILQRVFPDLRYGDDPDIGRYFDLRAAGKVGAALSIYNNGLRPRYPDDSKRIVLMNLYRRRDPRFPAFHDGLLWDLYDSVSRRLRKNLDALCDPLAGVPLRNTYRVLKAVESVVGMVPSGSYEALDFLDTYAAYAQDLGYRYAETRRVRALAGEYFQQVSDEEPDETDFLARSRAAEEKRRERETERARKSFFNLSKISFSKEDLGRIEIPASLERKEDRVLAFCCRYWLSVGDPALERIIFLYSRKYGTPHYDVFRAIKIGRARKFTDDEILNRVSTALSSSYSYSVQGDIYLQRSWRLLKAKLMGMEAPGAEVRGEEAPAPRSDVTPKAGETGKAAARGARGRRDRLPEAEGTEPSGLLARNKPARARKLAPVKRPEAVPVLAKGSVSDRIKRLSGKRYDVYREEFLASSRSAIERYLAANRNRPKDRFEDPINKAEDAVYEFLSRNYANPFMDWEDSQARSKVEALGFSVPNLDAIIEDWYRNR